MSIALPRCGRNRLSTERIDYIANLFLTNAIGDAIPIQDYVTELDIVEICHATVECLAAEAMLLEIPLDQRGITVIGDIHGNFSDLLRILDDAAAAERGKMLFLGDYVDRGPRSIEVLLLLFLCKLRWPQGIFLLRGNHETIETNERYSFFKEIEIAFPQSAREIHLLFNDVFDMLPVAAVLGGDQVLCVHGGISRFLTSRDAIRCIPRPTRGRHLDIFSKMLLTDLLWSDPTETQHHRRKFIFSQRKIGYAFSKKALVDALAAVGVRRLVRAHQTCEGGIKEVFDGLCVTIHTSSPLKLSSHLSTLRIICDVEEGGATFHVQEHDRFLQPLRYDRFQRLLAFDSDLWPPTATCGRCLMWANSKQDKCDLITPRCLSYDQAFQLAKEYAQENEDFLQLFEHSMQTRHPIATVIEKFPETMLKAVHLRRKSSPKLPIDDFITFAASDILRYLSSSSPTAIPPSPTSIAQVVPSASIELVESSSPQDEPVESAMSRKVSLDSNSSVEMDDDLVAVDDDDAERTLRILEFDIPVSAHSREYRIPSNLNRRGNLNVEEDSDSSFWEKRDSFSTIWTNEFC